MDLHEQDALVLSRMLDRREISAVELMQATLDRIKAVNGEINAIVALRDPDDLMAEAPSEVSRDQLLELGIRLGKQ